MRQHFPILIFFIAFCLFLLLFSPAPSGVSHKIEHFKEKCVCRVFERRFVAHQIHARSTRSRSTSLAVGNLCLFMFFLFSFSRKNSIKKNPPLLLCIVINEFINYIGKLSKHKMGRHRKYNSDIEEKASSR
jgi:hypothetical protein